jgi:hypothetical protein
MSQDNIDIGQELIQPHLLGLGAAPAGKHRQPGRQPAAPALDA